MASPIQLKNNAVGRLTSGVSSSATTLTLVSGDGAKFPTLTGAQYFPATLIRASDSAVEIVKVTARSGDVLTVVRGQEGTIGLVLLAGDRVEIRFTAGTFTDEVARIEAIAQDAASDAAAAAAAAQSTANSALSLASAAAPDTSVVKLTGAQTVAGVKTFSSSPVIPDATAAQNPVSKSQLDAAVSAISRGITRQSVLSGPVNADGLPAFGGSTGSTTVTASGTLVATAANGYGATGAADRVGVISNPSWTGLSTNGTMYLYLDIAANGTCTPGSTTLAPTYQRGGTYSTTNGQFTFNTSEMVGKVGDGSAANQTYRVFVGQVTVAGGAVTAITWYALKGEYRGSIATVPAAGTRSVLNHNIGVPAEMLRGEVMIENITTQGGWTAGQVVPWVTSSASGSRNVPGLNFESSTALSVVSGSNSAIIINSTTGTEVTGTPANWRVRVSASRDW